MKKTLMVVALAFGVGAWAADTARVTVPGGATADYNSLQAALNACTGGETVTMLTDATLTSQVKINADVTLDLDGHTITMTAFSDFLGFSSNLTATICGGGTVEVRTARSLITVKKGTTVNVTNCTLKGYCMFYGDNNTGKLNVMADTVALVDYPISSYSAAVLNVHAGHVASMRGWREGTGPFTSNIRITGGCFTRDPSFTEMLDGSVYGVKGVSETQALIDAGHAVTGADRSLGADGTLVLNVPAGSTREERAALVESLYRAQFKAAVPPLLRRWQPVLGVAASGVTIRAMTTRWGSCNTRTGHITLNLRLVEKDPRCLEYVVVHELCHLIVPDHSRAFWNCVARRVPDWRKIRALTNEAMKEPLDE